MTSGDCVIVVTVVAEHTRCQWLTNALMKPGQDTLRLGIPISISTHCYRHQLNTYYNVAFRPSQCPNHCASASVGLSLTLCTLQIYLLGMNWPEAAKN